jgi:hypothetical protein
MVNIYPKYRIKEYWMIYRRPGFLTVVWFWLLPPPHFPLQIIQYSLYQMVFGGGAKSCDGEKAWLSIDHSILSVRDSLWGRSQIIRQRESLLLYRPFNTLCIGWSFGEEPNHTMVRKPGPLKFIQYSLYGMVFWGGSKSYNGEAIKPISFNTLCTGWSLGEEPNHTTARKPGPL